MGNAARLSEMAKNKRSGKHIRVCRFCKVDSLLRLILSWIRVFSSGFPQQLGDFIALMFCRFVQGGKTFGG